ncbi:MAG TPA: amino acid permease [Nitrososphaerales archaeon]|nr:amino acid permease [Nitrososphaerales archaeon]
MKSENNPLFVRNATGLTRQIGSLDAFVGNILAMGLAYFFVFEFFATSLFPGVDLPVTILVTLIPGVVVALLYYLFTVAMPRTGGDYVWTSRILHPSVGFMTNLLLTFTWMSSLAVAVAWGISYGIVPMFAGIGLVNNDSSMLNLAATLSNSTNAFLLSVVFIIIFILPILLGTKGAFRVMLALFIVGLIGTLVTVGAFFSAPQATFIANFNKLSSMNYATTITTANLPLGFAAGATLTGSIFTMTNFLGFFSSAYFTGEVRRVARSQIIAMFGSLGFLIVIAFLIYGSAYYSAGSDFLSAISTLAAVGSTSYTLPAVPVLNFLVAFASPNPWVIAFSGIALLATGLGGATLFAFVAVRNLFAWSFDRVMPTALTKLDSRRGTPYISIIVIMIFAILFSAVYYFTQFFAFYVYGTLSLFIVFIMVSIAAIVFPYRLKSVFQSAPSVVNKKVGGVPLITILGVIGVIVNAYFGYATTSPAITPPPSGVTLQYLAFASVPVTIIAGFVIYAISYYVRKSQGISLGLAFKEIPPE